MTQCNLQDMSERQLVVYGLKTCAFALWFLVACILSIPILVLAPQAATAVTVRFHDLGYDLSRIATELERRVPNKKP